MKIEDITKTSLPLSLPKKTVLNILYTHNELSKYMHESRKPYGISGEQFNILRILRGQNGKPTNMQLLQERMIAKTSNTTRLVDKLLNKEFVTRNICNNNRRKIEVSITKKGLELLIQLDPIVEQTEAYFTRNLNLIELEQLNILLEKIRQQ